MKKQVLAAVAATLVGAVYFVFGRGYPWSLALLMGGAIGALVFSSLQATGRLRNLRRPPDE